MRIVHNYGGKWEEDAHIGTHIPLPLDPAQFDAAGFGEAVRVVLKALVNAREEGFMPSHAEVMADAEDCARAALAAYAQAVGGAP